MLAIGLTIGLFLYWGVVGCAVIRALRTRMPPLQEMLLAPVVGVVLTILPVFILSRAGIPVSRFGYPLAIALLVVAGALAVLVQRPTPFVDLPWRDYAPFAAALLLALLLTGRPMFEYGLDWVSFCNDDMANYCLGAVRFHQHGFFEAPRYSDLMRGADYSLFYWFFHVPGMGRTGSELLIAWVMSVTGLSPHQVFMPLILAFHVCQVSAIGALVYRSPRHKAAALAACLLLAGSPLASFGALYQLNSQVIGLALLAAAAAALLRPYGTAEIDGDGATSTAGAPTRPADPQRCGLLIRQGILVGLLMSGLFVLYPEVLPMLGLAWVIYVALHLVRRRANPRAVLIIVGVAAATGVILLWRHVRVVFVFVLGQASAGSTGGDVQNIYYPFYLLPSGLADLWGFFPLTRVPPEPFGSIAILLAAALLAMTAVMAVWLARREQPVGMLAAVMIALGLFLFLQRASFGMYKLAMFIQPFLLGTVAVAWLTLVPARPASNALATRRGYRLRRYGPLVLLAAPGLFVQQGYVQASRGRGQGTGFGELPDPSASRVNADFRSLLAANGVPDGLKQAGRKAAEKPSTGLVIDSYNVVLAKFQAVYARGTDAAFPSTNLGTAVMAFNPAKSQAPQWALYVGGELYEQVFASFGKYRFDLHDPASPTAVNEFEYRTLGPPIPSSGTESAASPLFVGAGGKQAVFNRWHGRSGDQNFFAAPMGRVRDHLMFMESSLGKGYYLTPRDVAIFQLEPDPKFILGTTMSAVGRHILFEVVNPSPQVRMVLDFTTSLRSDQDNTLPPAAVIGAQRQFFPVAGRGSARVVSPPLAVQTIGGHSFIALDLGHEAGPFPMRRGGLMRLYGHDINLDWRRIVAFARDISLVSERQYAAMKPPASVETFPKDLQNRQLEYSGVYEDGWVSDRAWFHFARPWGAGGVAIKGNVPDLGEKSFSTEMTVVIDGEEVARKTLGLNWFEFTAPLAKDVKPQAGGRSKVELRFSRYQHLPLPDGRPVTFQIAFLGFSSAPAPPVELQKFPDDLGNLLLEPTGIDGDGWAAQKTSMKLTQPPDRSELVVRGMVPKVNGAGGEAFKTTLRLRVDGKVVGEHVLGLDRFEVRSHVSPSASPTARRVELEFSDVQRLPPPDVRTVSCKLASVGFERPAAPPERVEHFPQDVRNPLLKASGVYEDGWVGPEASLRLTQPADADELTVRGTVPQIGPETGDPFRAELTVLVDGRPVARQPIGPGPLELHVPAPARPPGATERDPRRVELRFSATQTLPPPDARPVGARVAFAGFTSPREP